MDAAVSGLRLLSSSKAGPAAMGASDLWLLRARRRATWELYEAPWEALPHVAL